MASEERKAADNKIKEQNFQKSLGAGEQQAETDAFQCQRCKQVRFNSYPFPPQDLPCTVEQMSLPTGANKECR